MSNRICENSVNAFSKLILFIRLLAGNCEMITVYSISLGKMTFNYKMIVIFKFIFVLLFVPVRDTGSRL